MLKTLSRELNVVCRQLLNYYVGLYYHLSPQDIWIVLAIQAVKLNTHPSQWLSGPTCCILQRPRRIDPRHQSRFLFWNSHTISIKAERDQSWLNAKQTARCVFWRLSRAYLNRLHFTWSCLKQHEEIGVVHVFYSLVPSPSSYGLNIIGWTELWTLLECRVCFRVLEKRQAPRFFINILYFIFYISVAEKTLVNTKWHTVISSAKEIQLRFTIKVNECLLNKYLPK